MSTSNNLFDLDESKQFYDERYDNGYMDDWPSSKKLKIQEVLRALKLPAKGTALDFGCGTGVLTDLIRQSLPGWTVYGTDLSTAAIAKAKSRYGNCQFFVPGDSDSSGLKFDLVVSHHVLEHVYDIDAVLDEIDKYLNATAAMLHILPCGNEKSFCHTLCAIREGGINRELGNRYFFEDEGHVRRLTTEGLASICARQGFQIKQEYYTGQFFGAIDYCTKNEPQLAKLLADWKRGVNFQAKLHILIVGVFLRMIVACRSVVSWYDKLRWSRTKKVVAWLRLGIGLPVYLVARGVDRLITRLANLEWDKKKSSRNGDQMFLYFSRP